MDSIIITRGLAKNKIFPFRIQVFFFKVLHDSVCRVPGIFYFFSSMDTNCVFQRNNHSDYHKEINLLQKDFLPLFG